MEQQVSESYHVELMVATVEPLLTATPYERPLVLGALPYYLNRFEKI
jgi:hypothetical protein